MRKSLWIMLATLLVAVTGPISHADSFTYTYTSTDFGLSWTTAAISAITMETTVPAADLTAASTSGGFLAACRITSVVLDDSSVGNGNTQTNFSPGGACFTASAFSFDGFALADYSTRGTYLSQQGNTLVVTAAVAAPEPSSVALMLAGIGLVFVMRKRIGQGLPQAS
jgi:hypothetical protein